MASPEQPEPETRLNSLEPEIRASRAGGWRLAACLVTARVCGALAWSVVLSAIPEEVTQGGRSLAGRVRQPGASRGPGSLESGQLSAG